MEAREPIKTADASLTRDLMHAVRYYLGTRQALVVIAVAVAAAGIALNWSWLIAAGIAPILLSTLPCLIMCGLGYCMMCGSNKTQSAASRDVEDSATESTPQAKQLQPTEERRDSHA